MRKGARHRLATAAAVGLLLSACGGTPEPAERPNVLLIVVDTLRRDHVGAYGQEPSPSPNLDRLAAESVRYDRALSQAPWTLPSVVALLTSRDPAALGISDLDSVVGEELVLLSEALRAHGYVTGAVVSHKLCSSRWGLDQGFDSFDESNVRGHAAVTSPGVTDAALAFLDAHGSRDFFLFVHYFDPHFVYLEHEGFASPRDASYRGPVKSGLRYERLARLRLDDADRRELRRIYDSEVAFTDHHVGRLLDGLRERGLLEETLLVFTADHGEEFMDRGRVGHGRTLFEELVGVPLLVRFPGGRPGVVRSPVALLDVFPTVLEAAGIPVGSGVEGRPLPREAGSGRERLLFAATDRGPGETRAAVDSRYKLVRHSSGRTRLFDLEADPGEARDLSDRLGSLAPHLDEALRGYERRVASAREAAPRIDLTREERESLRALGYHQDP